jgi:hypothetical protein
MGRNYRDLTLGSFDSPPGYTTVPCKYRQAVYVADRYVYTTTPLGRTHYRAVGAGQAGQTMA